MRISISSLGLIEFQDALTLFMEKNPYESGTNVLLQGGGFCLYGFPGKRFPSVPGVSHLDLEEFLRPLLRSNPIIQLKGPWMRVIFRLSPGNFFGFDADGIDDPNVRYGFETAVSPRDVYKRLVIASRVYSEPDANDHIDELISNSGSDWLNSIQVCDDPVDQIAMAAARSVVWVRSLK